jgi:Zn-dependent M28 family amino/carboxypeptidase
MAEALRQKRAFRSQVIFLFSGAEELGLQGAFAYLQKHRKEIEKEKSCFVNLDCVGVQGRTRIFSRKGFFPVGKESIFVSRLKEIGKPFKIGLWSFSFGFLMDHQAMMEKGYQAVTLACPSKKILKVHTADDTGDHLEKEGIEEIGKFILAWIESFEKGRDLGKPGPSSSPAEIHPQALFEPDVNLYSHLLRSVRRWGNALLQPGRRRPLLQYSQAGPIRFR